MTDITTATKTLKAIGEGGEALRCKESDSAEVQRQSLKKIRRAAGPAVSAFIMGVLR